jgi:nucleoside-diphosphate-sugar epimerase
VHVLTEEGDIEPKTDSIVRRSFVTGCAGFIGSHVCDRLVELGHEVVGLDAFTDYYDRADKERNIAGTRLSPLFRLIESDVFAAPLEHLLDGVDFVFHLAGQPGVRPSWGADFELYTRQNMLTTQHLLEACKRTGVRRMVFSSSSSVYGDATDLPVHEDSLTRPVSPYGVTKLAAEQLCLLYHRSFGVPAVILRYFTVFGPRQRPDMAFHRFIAQADAGEPISVHGDGAQTRDFTHVSDVVDATVQAALSKGATGNVYNIAGGTRVTLNEAIAAIARTTGRTVEVDYGPRQVGDARDTYADISRARQHLAYDPRVSLEQGIADEVNWYRETKLRASVATRSK